MTFPPAAPYGRLLTAMATAFHVDGAVDLDATAAVAAYLVDEGNDGVVVSGTTGESPTTSVDEDGEILRAVKAAVGDRATVVAGVGTNSTEHSVALARQAAAVGVDAVLLVAPYYNKPSQAGLLHHFTQVARVSDIPIMLYDVPGRTGVAIAPQTYEAAAKIETVSSVKDATGDPAHAVFLRSLGYDVYSGDDAKVLGFLAHGSCGLVSVAAHAAAPQLKSLIDDFLAGDVGSALDTYTRLAPVIDAIMGVANYGATTAKAALQLRGVLDNRRVRGPLVELDDAEYAALGTALRAASLL